MKLYVSADMEGVTGVVTDAQLGAEGFDYERACELYTDEVVAVVEAAREVGVSEVVVSDSHGSGQNLRIDRLPAGVRLVRSWPRPLGMMEGIDDSFAGAVLLGYHTGTHQTRGIRAHTLSSAVIHRLELNGQPVCEAQLNTFLAGHFGVPVVMVSGDDALMDEIAAALPDVEQVVTKRSISYHCAECLSPADVLPALRAGVQAGLARRESIGSATVSGAVTVDLTFKNHRPADLLAYLPTVERTGSHAVQYRAEDIVDASRFLEFALNYRADLQP